MNRKIISSSINSPRPGKVAVSTPHITIVSVDGATLCDGVLLGIALCDGVLLGIVDIDGDCEGWSLGTTDGFELGIDEGLGLGSGLSVGPNDLVSDGIAEGVEVGTYDTDGVELGICETVGNLVGDSEGLGLGIGDSVGLPSCKLRSDALVLCPTVRRGTARQHRRIVVKFAMDLMVVICCSLLSV